MFLFGVDIHSLIKSSSQRIEGLEMIFFTFSLKELPDLYRIEKENTSADAGVQETVFDLFLSLSTLMLLQLLLLNSNVLS